MNTQITPAEARAYFSAWLGNLENKTFEMKISRHLGELLDLLMVLQNIHLTFVKTMQLPQLTDKLIVEGYYGRVHVMDEVMAKLYSQYDVSDDDKLLIADFFKWDVIEKASQTT